MIDEDDVFEMSEMRVDGDTTSAVREIDFKNLDELKQLENGPHLFYTLKVSYKDDDHRYRIFPY